MYDPDFTTQYCSTRRDLEERGWILTSRLFELSTRLLRTIGNDRQEFAAIKQECGELRGVIGKAQSDLRGHRSKHGC